LDILAMTEAFSQEPNEIGILFDGDDHPDAPSELGRDYSLARSDFVNDVCWAEPAGANQPLDKPWAFEKILREPNALLLPFFHVSPPVYR
jgi:hypothetical protein